jgi:hypothetical protein
MRPARLLPMALLALAPALARAQARDSVPRPARDSTRPAQALPGVSVEAAPAPPRLSPAEERVRTGGHLVTKADIQKFGAITWLEAARLAPGVAIATFPVRRGSTLLDKRLTILGPNGRCVPTIYLNGMPQVIPDLEWEQLVSADVVETIEVYTALHAPAQFRPSNPGCGSVVVWTVRERR